jgi:hypothetical protein
MWVTNYRNEPVALRVFNPNKAGPDGKLGSQADGLAGDLAFALQTRTDRAIAALNTRLGNTPYPPVGSGDGINRDRRPGDPFTPIMRTYEGDNVKVKIQSGATEEQHQVSIHGVKWLSTGSGFGKAGNSGWRNFQSAGISEQFSLQVPMNANLGQSGGTADYLYSTDVSRDGWWTGVWGVMRNYGAVQADLFQLPDNPRTGRELTVNAFEFRNVGGNRVCPLAAPVKTFNVSAVLANNVLDNAAALGVTIPRLTDPDPLTGLPFGQATVGGGLTGTGTLVYNRRGTVVPDLQIVDDAGAVVTLPGGSGPLNDPTAMMYVLNSDLVAGKLRPNAPVEPLVLRANAGDCIVVNLTNRLPAVAPDLAGWSDVMWVVNRDLFVDPLLRTQNEMVFFNNNLIRPSSNVGMTPQLVEYDITRSDGINVGTNPVQTAAPNTTKQYVWYAGDIRNDVVIQVGAEGAGRLAGNRACRSHGGRDHPGARWPGNRYGDPPDAGQRDGDRPDRCSRFRRHLPRGRVDCPEGSELPVERRYSDAQPEPGRTGNRRCGGLRSLGLQLRLRAGVVPLQAAARRALRQRRYARLAGFGSQCA